MEFEKKICPIVNVDGIVASGKQFDIDISLPKDDRNVIYGIVKDSYKEPIENAVVKLIEIDCDHGKEERKPVSHTFTNEAGEFVFGPLCPNKFYEINIWVNRVKHVKVCAKCKHEGKCLKGTDIRDCDFTIDCKPCHPCKPDHCECKPEKPDYCECKPGCNHREAGDLIDVE